MKPTIVGFGNPLRRDDGVGYRAAVELEELGYPAHAFLQPLPELALEVANSQIVIFLDAEVTVAPGEIRFREGVPAASFDWNHAFTPEAILKLAGELEGCYPKSFVLSIGVADLGFGEGFSPQVESAYAEYIYRAKALVEGICTN